MEGKELSKRISTSLRCMDKDTHKAVILDVILGALKAVDPYICVLSNLQKTDKCFFISGVEYDLRSLNNIYLVSIGKAALPMAKAFLDKMGEYVKEGIIVTKKSQMVRISNLNREVTVLRGGHPIPNQSSIDSAHEIIKLLHKSKRDDLVVFLISGGASALVTDPINNVSIDDLQQMTKALLRSGADIGEINCLRKHLDRIKGGGMARLAKPSRIATLVLSDVIGNPLGTIASGPTVADESTFLDAFDILNKYKLVSTLPESIMKTIKAGIDGHIEETAKPGSTYLENVHNSIIASNLTAARIAKKVAIGHKFNSLIYTTYLNGEANQAGIFISSLIKEVAYHDQPLKRPACLILGGETTVTIKGNGTGGRNLELALGAVRELSSIEDIALITLATDGEDGPTDAAGAIVTGQTLLKGECLGLYPEEFLRNNDSYTYFQQVGNLIKIGSTGTNVNDLNLLFIF